MRETHETAGINWKLTNFGTHQHTKLPKDSSSDCSVVVYKPSPWFFCRLSCVSQVVSASTLEECKDLFTPKQAKASGICSHAASLSCMVFPKLHHQNPSKIYPDHGVLTLSSVILLTFSLSQGPVRSAWAWSTVGVAVSCGRDQQASKHRFP